MNYLILKLRSLIEREEGQDLVECALVVALIAFGAVTAMKGLSTEIKLAFNTISSELGSALSRAFDPWDSRCWRTSSRLADARHRDTRNQAAGRG